MPRLTNELRDFLVRTTRHPLGFIGVNLTTLSGVLLVTLLLLSAIGQAANPYLGAITFLVLPAVFVFGLILIPVGSWVHRRRLARAEAGADIFPVYDLNRAKVRTRLVLLAVLTLTNITILGVASYKGIEFMDSVHFCGNTCHPIMRSEYVAYQGSPHARVRCVDCHIGPGASWFVQSKLSGTRQVVKQLTHTWPTPIKVPITSLRPSRDTCEQCHWPERFQGDALVVRRHFEEDSANTATENVLLLKIGGKKPGAVQHEGIHWHVASSVYYRSDESRETIPWVRVERPDGKVTEYTAAGGVPDSIAARPMRRMDCIDCHNRPTHIYRLPARALDEAMTDGRLPVDLPFFKREAMAALTTEYADEAAARAGIGARLSAFYADTAAAPQKVVTAAIAGVGDIWAHNVFPSMKVGWGTYPNHIGHKDFTGCFRCHDEQHTSSDGATISQDCSTCHSLLAMEEENPEVLRTLYPEGE